MFKRFTCMILSFVLLLALVPAGAIEASAATNATSDKAITILKVFEPFEAECDIVTAEIGYGTPCTGTGAHGGVDHTIRENEADEALRKALKDLDTVVNTFASNNGISLSQSQHDALVLFTFRNGKAWMSGSDELRSCVLLGTKGNDFINAMINWRGEIDIVYRKVLANMYLNGKYSSTAPANYVRIVYDTNGGSLQTSKTVFYYDRSLSESTLQVPTRSGYRFSGWLSTDNNEARKTLIAEMPKADSTVYASWQADSVTAKAPIAYYHVGAIELPGNEIHKEVNGAGEGNTVKGKVTTIDRYVDENFNEWLKIRTAEEFIQGNKTNKNYTFSTDRWINWRNVLTGTSNGSGSSSGGGGGMWVPVTVTNAYINVRERANIYSTQIGTVYAGEKYWVAATEENTGYLWGLIYSDKGEVGYVALMYTDYDDVIAGNSWSSTPAAPVDTVVARARIIANAYVNVRSGAGTGNPIVSSLRKDAQVDLYETKYVNGQQWGRCKTGWFSLAYADVTRLVAESTGSDVGFMSYVFTAELKNAGALYDGANSGNLYTNPNWKAEEVPTNGKTVTISNITATTNGTWGKVTYGSIYWGWAKLTDNAGAPASYVEMKPAKFTTIAEASVRKDPANGAERLNTLAVGTEVTVTTILADENTIWAYTSVDKNGSNKYQGWVNLSQKYFGRNSDELNLEKPSTSVDTTACTLGTVIDCVEVNMRKKASIYGAKVGTLPAGTVVEIIEGPVNGTRRTGWYRLAVNLGSGVDAWVRGDYLDVRQGTRAEVTYGKKPSTSPDGTAAATGRGIVANTYGGVNVRTAPGTVNAKVTKLLPGTEVTILDVTLYGSTKWGKIEQGWVCMDYIAMMDYDDLPTAPSATVTEKAVYTGYINITGTTSNLELARAIKSGEVIVYATANGADDNIVRYLPEGEAVTIHELLTATEIEDRDSNILSSEDYGTTSVTITSYWARINDGYIKLPEFTVALDALDEDVYTVTGTDLLKVRKAPGAGADRHEFDLKKGDQVKVTNLQIVQANVWGQIEHNELEPMESAWISLAYCTPGAVDTSTPEKPENGSTDSGIPVEGTILSQGNTGKGNYMGTIIGQYPKVNVRKDASTNAEVVTELNKGASVTISETKLVDGRSWGYCGTGWINLVYVDLTPVGITAIDAKVIATDNTLCYESSETGAKVVGSYASRAVVNIYEEINGMYRTDMGWVAKNNFL